MRFNLLSNILFFRNNDIYNFDIYDGRKEKVFRKKVILKLKKKIY